MAQIENSKGKKSFSVQQKISTPKNIKLNILNNKNKELTLQNSVFTQFDGQSISPNKLDLQLNLAGNIIQLNINGINHQALQIKNKVQQKYTDLYSKQSEYCEENVNTNNQVIQGSQGDQKQQRYHQRESNVNTKNASMPQNEMNIVNIQPIETNCYNFVISPKQAKLQRTSLQGQDFLQEVKTVQQDIKPLNQRNKSSIKQALKIYTQNSQAQKNQKSPNAVQQNTQNQISGQNIEIQYKNCNKIQPIIGAQKPIKLKQCQITQPNKLNLLKKSTSNPKETEERVKQYLQYTEGQNQDQKISPQISINRDKLPGLQHRIKIQVRKDQTSIKKRKVNKVFGSDKSGSVQSNQTNSLGRLQNSQQNIVFQNYNQIKQQQQFQESENLISEFELPTQNKNQSNQQQNQKDECTNYKSRRSRNPKIYKNKQEQSQQIAKIDTQNKLSLNNNQQFNTTFLNQQSTQITAANNYHRDNTNIRLPHFKVRDIDFSKNQDPQIKKINEKAQFNSYERVQKQDTQNLNQIKFSNDQNLISTNVFDSNFLNNSINSPNPNRQKFPLIFDSNRKTQFNIVSTQKLIKESYYHIQNPNLMSESPIRRKYLNQVIVESKKEIESPIQANFLDSTKNETKVSKIKLEQQIKNELKIQRLMSIKQTFMKAKDLGYICIQSLKNKDSNAWTQPSDPLLIKQKQILKLPNIYSEDLYQQPYDFIDQTLISSQDQIYIENYAQELFNEMLIQENKDGIWNDYYETQPKIERMQRMKIIDWLFEQLLRFDITDRSIMFQTVELMDQYYQNFQNAKNQSDLQLTAITCFFIASKNILVEPFNLQQAQEMCFSKYTKLQILKKEVSLRKLLGYNNEMSNYLDYILLFIKLAKVEFCKYLESKKKYKTKKIMKSTVRFFNDLEVLSYELSKLALVDGFLKRYMKSYVSASILCIALDIFADLIIKDIHNLPKYDLDQISQIYIIFSEILTKYYGYNKYLFFQFMAKFINNRFQCFYFQLSGILTQKKTLMMQYNLDQSSSNEKITLQEKELDKLKVEFSESKFLFKEKLCKHLHSAQIKFQIFFKDFIPSLKSLPFTEQNQLYIFHLQNDKKFHNQLVKMLKKADQFYFKSFYELKEELERLLSECIKEDISLHSKEYQYFQSRSNSYHIDSPIQEPQKMYQLQIQKIQNSPKFINQCSMDNSYESSNRKSSSKLSFVYQQLKQKEDQMTLKDKYLNLALNFDYFPSKTDRDMLRKDTETQIIERIKRFEYQSRNFEGLALNNDFLINSLENKNVEGSRITLKNGEFLTNNSSKKTETKSNIISSILIDDKRQTANHSILNQKLSLYTNDFCLSSKQKNSTQKYKNSESPNNAMNEIQESRNVTIYKNKNSSRKKSQELKMKQEQTIEASFNFVSFDNNIYFSGKNNSSEIQMNKYIAFSKQDQNNQNQVSNQYINKCSQFDIGQHNILIKKNSPIKQQIIGKKNCRDQQKQVIQHVISNIIFKENELKNNQHQISQNTNKLQKF